MRRNKGFTLLELIIVVIVIGILASIALPRYLRVAEKARVAEAKSLLATIRDSQMRYSAQFNGFATAVTTLDVPMPTTKYFTMTVPAVAGPVLDDASILGLATRTALDNPTGVFCAYNINQNGTIAVASGGATCINYL